MKKQLLILMSLLLIGLIGFYVFTIKNKESEATNKTKDKHTLKVAYQVASLEFNYLMTMAEENGFFEKNNLKIEKITVPRNITTLILSGEADIAFSSIPPILSAYLEGQDFVWLRSVSNFPSNLNAVSRYAENDLGKVKRVAVLRIGGADHMISEMVLNKDGNANIDYITAGDDAIKIAMLEKKEVDFAFIFSEEAFNNIKSRGGYTFIEAENLFEGKMIPQGIISTKKFLNSDNNREAAKLFVKSIEQTIDFLSKNQNIAVKYLSDKYGFTPEEALAQYNRVKNIQEAAIKLPNEHQLSELVKMVKRITKNESVSRSLDDFFFKFN